MNRILWDAFSSRKAMANNVRWESGSSVYTAPLCNEFEDRSNEFPPFHGRRHDPQAGRLLQERRAGLRKRAMTSGVNWIHHGPCDDDWIPSKRPDWHQSAIVDTVTFF